MPVFDWRDEPTRFFGRQPYPFIRIAIQSQSGRWRTLSMLVDTGAVVSLLSCSAAKLLEVDIASGRQIFIKGVGQREAAVFVHPLLVRISDIEPSSMRFAVSTSENVPNLLGRLDLLDRFRIVFDPSVRQTQVALP